MRLAEKEGSAGTFCKRPASRNDPSILLLSLVAWAGGFLVHTDKIVAAAGLVHGKTVAVSQVSPILVVNRGRSDGVRVADRAIVHHQREVLAAGEVIYAEGRRSAIRYRCSGDALPNPLGLDVVVVPSSIELADGPEVYRVAHLDRVLPGGGRFWIDGGRREGWRPDAEVLIRRGSSLLGWGRILEVDRQASLVQVRARVELDVPPRRGDRIEQFGVDPSGGRTRTRVAAVDQTKQPPVMTLAGDRDTGFSTGDRVDFFREGQYVAFGRISSVFPSLELEVMTSVSRGLPRIADVALVRTEFHDDTEQAGYVFRTEGTYGLATLGENDGISRGENLACRLSDQQTVELQVKTVYPDHCGVSILNPSGEQNSTLPLWAKVWRRSDGGADHPMMSGFDRTHKAQRSELAPWLLVIDHPNPQANVGDLLLLAGKARTVAVAAVVFESRIFAVRLDHLRY